MSYTQVGSRENLVLDKRAVWSKRKHSCTQQLNALVKQAAHLVIVSNEVLDELPSKYAETEIYSKWLGRIHQALVKKADTAIEMDYGIPIVWKNERQEVMQ